MIFSDLRINLVEIRYLSVSPPQAKNLYSFRFSNTVSLIKIVIMKPILAKFPPAAGFCSLDTSDVRTNGTLIYNSLTLRQGLNNK